MFFEQITVKILITILLGISAAGGSYYTYRQYTDLKKKLEENQTTILELNEEIASLSNKNDNLDKMLKKEVAEGKRKDDVIKDFNDKQAKRREAYLRSKAKRTMKQPENVIEAFCLASPENCEDNK